MIQGWKKMYLSLFVLLLKLLSRLPEGRRAKGSRLGHLVSSVWCFPPSPGAVSSWWPPGRWWWLAGWGAFVVGATDWNEGQFRSHKEATPDQPSQIWAHWVKRTRISVISTSCVGQDGTSKRVLVWSGMLKFPVGYFQSHNLLFCKSEKTKKTK